MNHVLTDTTVLHPVRSGVFPTLRETDSAVAALLAAGFSVQEISVLCSDHALQQYFHEFQHQQPAGENTPAAATAGGTLGATLAGIGAVVAGISLGGLPLLVLGGAGMLTGGIVGGLVGAMMTRGYEKEAANFYSEAVAAGHFLVAVEPVENNRLVRLEEVERILAAAGAKPLEMVEG